MGDGSLTPETIATLLIRVEQSVKALEQKIDDQRAEYVSHAVWVQRNAHVDTALKNVQGDVEEIKAGHREALKELRADLHEGIAQIRDELQARRVPWTAVGAFVVAASALVVQLIERLAGG